MMLNFNNQVQRSVNDANNDYVGSSTAQIDHATVHILGIDGVGGGGDITASRSLFLDLTNLPEGFTVDAANDYMVFYDQSQAQHYKIKISNLISAGMFQYVRYISNSCTITASGLGVVVTKGSGTITATVPTGVHLQSINIHAVAADTDASDNLYVEIVSQNESTINQDFDSAILPSLTYVNTSYPILYNAGVCSETYPAQFDPYKTWAIVECGPSGSDAVLKLKIEAVRDDYYTVKLNF